MSEGEYPSLRDVKNPYVIIFEPEKELGINLALGKTAFTDTDVINNELLAIDGDKDTYFEAEYSYDMNFTIDLEAIYTVDKIRILWRDIETIATQFQIMTATDLNGSWSIVADEVQATNLIYLLEFLQQDVRYIKLYATGNESGFGYAISEFEVYGLAEPVLVPEMELGVNLALGKTAFTDTGVIKNELLAIDGDTDTYFEAEYSHKMNFIIDLEAIYTVDKVRILWHNMDASATQFQIMTATDLNGPWSTVADEVQATNLIYLLEFLPQDTRYIKLYATGNESGFGYAICEFEVYGLVEPISVPVMGDTETGEEVEDFESET
jgi:hypothetical protein